MRSVGLFKELIVQFGIFLQLFQRYSTKHSTSSGPLLTEKQILPANQKKKKKGRTE